jgi:hypothetical protein
MLCFVIFSLSRPSRTAISLILLAILCSPAILDSARSEGTNAENSRTATRYSDQQYRTAMDQSNDPDDIKTTAEIRKLVVGDGSLSIRAKNVMIITIHGYVTLRGASRHRKRDQPLSGTRSKSEQKQSSTNSISKDLKPGNVVSWQNPCRHGEIHETNQRYSR